MPRTLTLDRFTAPATIPSWRLPRLELHKQRPAWRLLAAALSLALFAWLRSLRPSGANRRHTASGAVCRGMALLWLPLAQGGPFSPGDRLAAGVLLSGITILMGGHSRG